MPCLYRSKISSLFLIFMLFHNQKKRKSRLPLSFIYFIYNNSEAIFFPPLLLSLLSLVRTFEMSPFFFGKETNDALTEPPLRVGWGGVRGAVPRIQNDINQPDSTQLNPSNFLKHPTAGGGAGGALRSAQYDRPQRTQHSASNPEAKHLVPSGNSG